MAKTAAALKIASDYDLGFMKVVTNDQVNPEYSGNIKFTRESGRGIQNATIAIHLPLIDKPLKDHLTMMTALVEAICLTEESCQPYTIFTCDQQLHKIVLDIKWTYEKFQNVISRLGGMHSLMSFVGSIGCLMLNAGLHLILKFVFGSVEKMLNEKFFPQNI